MINKINLAQGIQQIQSKPAFRAKETDNENVTAPDNSVSFKGADALANYNKPNVMAFDKSLLEVEPILPTIIAPEAIGSIEGEKIYGSNGKLNSIVNRVGDKTVIYKASAENDNMLESITTIDKKSGNVVKEQRNTAEEGRNYTVVTEYDAATGKEIGSTEYVDGNPDYASKVINEEKGQTVTVFYDYNNGHYTVYQDNDNSRAYKRYEFNKNKELISIDDKKNVRGNEINSSIEFYNGAVISAHQSKTEVIPNNMGREVMSDADVQPADISAYPDSIEGEKTFFSNGSLESVTAGDLVYHYSPEGNITFIEDGNKTVEVKNKTTIITENLEDGAKKTTKYNPDNYVSVDYKKGDYNKHLSINNGNPSWYYEDHGERSLKSYHFNDKGMLESAWGDNI